MRHLAISRFRLLTTIRGANLLFAVAFVAAFAPLLFITGQPDEVFRDSADVLLGEAARVSVFAWIFHALLLGFACDMFGNVTLLRSQLTSGETDRPSDLMDTAPIRPGAYFWGEAGGIFAAAMSIHVCALPLLALLAALSPLPISMFFIAEAATIALVIMASAGGAWKRRAPRSRWSGTRGPRSAALFGIIVLLMLRRTTHWIPFRDALAVFATEPSPRLWAPVVAAVENPLLLFVLLAFLCIGYIAFFYKSSARMARG
jgi:hypothetical protein